MKTLTRHPLLLGLAGLAGTALLAAVLALDGTPRVSARPMLSADDVARTRQFLRANDPRSSSPGELRQLQLPQAELDLLINQAALRWPGAQRPALQLQLQQGRAQLQASLALRPGLWLNLELGLREAPGGLQLDQIRLGQLPLPAGLGHWALEQWLLRQGLDDEWLLARQMLRGLSIQPGQLTVSYEWRADSYARIVAGLVGPQDQQRLRAQAELLARWTEARAKHGAAPLAELLPAAFALAHQRSRLPGGDAAAENRAALLNLAFYALGRDPARLLADPQAWPQARPLPMLLRGRVDFPQHFIVSAALAAAGGGPLADAIGVYKEQLDVRFGSGFSFNDLAADRAGSRFGLLAVRDPHRLQQRLAQGLRDHDLLPDVSDLPEYLSEAEFRRRYGAVDAPAYQRMMAAIEARLDSLSLLR